MTRTVAPPVAGIPSRGRVVAAGVTVLAMALACVGGLGDLVVAGPWRWTVAVMLTTVTAAIVATRLGLRAWRGPDVSTLTSLVPSVVGLLVGGWLVVARFGHSEPRATTSTFDLFVSLKDFQGIGRLARAVEEVAVTTVAPIEPLEAIVALFAAGACLVLVLMDMFVAVRVPALAGLATSLLWLPSLMIVGDLPSWSVVAVVALLLVLLAIDRPTLAGPHDADRRSLRDVAPGVAQAGLSIVGVVAAGVALSLVLPTLPGRGVVAAPDVRRGVANLTDSLDLRRSLQEQSTREVLTYTVSKGAPAAGPFRTTSLLDFDGRAWEPGESDAAPVQTGDLLWPSLADGTAASGYALRMQFEGLSSTTVPVPLDPRVITSEREVSYDPDRDAVVAAERVSSGDVIEMTVLPRELDPATLRARSPLGVPGPLDFPGSASILQRALATPATSHSGDVAALARTIVGEATNSYDAAVALQDHLRSGPGFTYSLAVPEPTSDDAVWDFLQDGTGYCVQFASAMTIMARSLGIPARVSIGYLPGDVESDGVAVVRGRDAHAWPEIYVDDVGWVRFEPTPGIQSGTLPGYASTATATPSATPTTRTPTPSRSTASATRPGATRPTQSATSATSAGSSPAPLALGLVVLVLVGAAVVAMVVRRRRAETRVRDVEEAWEALLAAARSAGIDVDAAATLRTSAALIDPQGGSAAALAQLVEVARYAPAPPDLEPPALVVLLDEALATLDARVAAEREAEAAARRAP